MRRPRRARWLSVLRLVVRDCDPECTRSITLCLFVRLIGGDLLPCGLACCPGERPSEVPQWARRSTLRTPGALLDLANQHHKSLRSPRLRRFNETGRALFGEPPVLGIGCETTVSHEESDPPGRQLAGKRGIQRSRRAAWINCSSSAGAR